MLAHSTVDTGQVPAMPIACSEYYECKYANGVFRSHCVDKSVITLRNAIMPLAYNRIELNTAHNYNDKNIIFTAIRLYARCAI